MPTCEGCGKEILWIYTETRQQMAVNPCPVKVVLQDRRVVLAYVPHLATCPAADRFKKKIPGEG